MSLVIITTSVKLLQREKSQLGSFMVSHATAIRFLGDIKSEWIIPRNCQEDCF